MKPEEALELLRQAHRHPIDEGHFTAVRARVLAEIEAQARRPAWRRWGWKWALSALAAAAALAILPMRPDGVARLRSKPSTPAQAMRAALSRQTGPRVLARPARRTARRVHAQVSAASYRVVGPPNPQPLVVKMLTDDPNVVIYWIAEGTGE